MRYRAVLAYDGTAYQGFQRLAGEKPSVQAAVERALTAVSGQTVRVRGAARTDTGVHASGQMIAFDVEWRHLDQKLMQALNATLPDDIAVQRLERAAPRFHPRFDASSRTYRYMIYQAAARQPLYARTTWHIREPLDVAAMNCAATELIGEHDFATFGAPTQGTRTVRAVYRSAWQAEPLTDGGGLLSYTIEANAFLQHMVRVLVGTMVDVGLGKWSPADFTEAFCAADRSRAQRMAPPHGLILTAVTYDDTADRPDQLETEDGDFSE